MLLVLVVTFEILFTEARVFCEDSNALSWKPLGKTCPITCSTIKTAVDRLKMRDYQYLVEDTNKKRTNISASDIYVMGQRLQNNMYGRRSNSLQPDTSKHITLYQTYHRLLSNEYFENALKIEAGKMTLELNKTCSNMAAKDLYKKIVNIKCTRKLNKKSDVLKKFTKFLNIYADPRYPFDEEMVGIILQKLEGSFGLWYGEIDYKGILNFLRKSLKYYRSQTKVDQIIKLQSKRCLTLSLPGCFCKIGFVERHGLCVKPEDCMVNSMFTEYLERIILY